MKKIFLFLFMGIFACGSISAKKVQKKVAYQIIVTECGEQVRIPAGDYSTEFLDMAITEFTRALC